MYLFIHHQVEPVSPSRVDVVLQRYRTVVCVHHVAGLEGRGGGEGGGGGGEGRGGDFQLFLVSFHFQIICTVSIFNFHFPPCQHYSRLICPVSIFCLVSIFKFVLSAVSFHFQLFTLSAFKLSFLALSALLKINLPCQHFYFQFQLFNFK